jgi:hypothetical protein
VHTGIYPYLFPITPTLPTMSSNQHLEQGEVSVHQPQESATFATRTRRAKRASVAKSKMTTSASISKQHRTTRMPSSSSSVPPQRNQSRKRASSYLSDSDESAGAMRSSRAKRPVFTKTGRISKALKGVKVHECDHCGKVNVYPFIFEPCWPLLLL